VQIRPATAADIPSIVKLERQSATAGHWTEGQYQKAFQREGATRLVLVADDPRLAPDQKPAPAETTLLGFLVALHVAPEWELENIVVAPAARRKGMGKRLLAALFAAARETNSAAVFLEVRESNSAARTLYETAGFKPTGRRKVYYTNPSEDAVLYRLTLP
jgi:[ribosomal protein S18]-alanine N-acetyltransferase